MRKVFNLSYMCTLEQELHVAQATLRIPMYVSYTERCVKDEVAKIAHARSLCRVGPIPTIKNGYYSESRLQW